MGVSGLLAATLAVATVNGQIPDYAGGDHQCGSESIPFAHNVACDNYCPESVSSYGDKIATSELPEAQTVAAFYYGGFF